MLSVLRQSVEERLLAAAEDFLLRLQSGGGAAEPPVEVPVVSVELPVVSVELPVVRALLTERLAAAAEEIVALLRDTVEEYEERLSRKERDVRKHKRLLDVLLEPRVRLRRTDVTTLEVKPERSCSMDQNQNQDQGDQDQVDQEEQDAVEEACPGIKEEPQDLEISFSPVPVKTEADEEKPDPSMLLDPVPDLDPGPDPDPGPESLKQEWDSGSDSELRPLSCSFCGKRFWSGGSLTRHVWVHSGEAVLECLVCRHRFSRESTLLSHRCVRSPSPPRPSFGCSLCHRSFGRPEELRLHAADHASCSVCGAAFAETEALVLHMRSHGAQTPFSCGVCGKGFAWRRLLSRHMELHRGVKVHRYSICRRTLCRRRTRLGQRHCIHRPAPNHQHHNEDAQIPGPAPNHQHHAEDAQIPGPAPNHQHHAEDAQIPGPAPPRSGPQPELDPDPERERCSTASLPPQSEDSADSDFWTEVRTRPSESAPSIAAPPGTKPEPEPDSDPGPPAEIEVRADGSRCGAAAVQKRFACSQCGKRFQYGYLLRRHQRSHSGEKPFRCTECSKTFSHKENLAYHMGLHTGHKRFSCSVCRRRFNWLSGVKRHVCIPEEDGPGPELEPGPGPGLEPGP